VSIWVFGGTYLLYCPIWGGLESDRARGFLRTSSRGELFWGTTRGVRCSKGTTRGELIEVGKRLRARCLLYAEDISACYVGSP
jgi:hypothetical protein